MIPLNIDQRLHALQELVAKYRLASLAEPVEICRSMIRDQILDIAVLGQFKSGKSSFLNTLIGESLFPVGVIPVTAVVTRAAYGPESAALVTRLDGHTDSIALGSLREYVDESANPANEKRVAYVDVWTPTLKSWPGIRIVDTPGLGSAHRHNTAATDRWLPQVAVAIVTVSCERPMSADDLELIAKVRELSHRIVVLVTKVDLLSDEAREQVLRFVASELRKRFGSEFQVLPFSNIAHAKHYRDIFQQKVLDPLLAKVDEERFAAIDVKLGNIAKRCRDYLRLEQAAADRDAALRRSLHDQVVAEQIKADLVHDELRMTQGYLAATIRPQLMKRVQHEMRPLIVRLQEELRIESLSWSGNLGMQKERYEKWLAGKLKENLEKLSADIRVIAIEFIATAIDRFRRLLDAMQARLGKSVHETYGVTITPLAWEPKSPEISGIMLAANRTFMTHWELLSWIIPMKLFGGIFRRHILHRIETQVETNLTRLVSDWKIAVEEMLAQVRAQACDWVDRELATLSDVLNRGSPSGERLAADLARLDELIPR